MCELPKQAPPEATPNEAERRNKQTRNYFGGASPPQSQPSVEVLDGKSYPVPKSNKLSKSECASLLPGLQCYTEVVREL